MTEVRAQKKNNHPFELILEQPDSFYIHDVTLLKEARGRGLAQKKLLTSFMQAMETNLVLS